MKRAYALVLRDEAQAEIEAIQSWYEEQGPGLGERFATALGGALKDLLRSPKHQVRKHQFRYTSIVGFPSYRIVYLLEGNVVIVYQVRHTSRRADPAFGP